MSTFKADDAPPEQLTAALRQAADDVPDEVARRLQDARRQAALAAEEPRARRLRPIFAVSAGVAVAALALAMGLNLSAPAPADIPLLPAGSDLEFAVSQELELLEELEFIAWLEEADRGAG